MVVDVQNAVVANVYRRDEVIANINALVDRARGADVPVIWVQHASENLVPETEAWAYVPELSRDEPEPLVHKRYGDAFEDTILEAELARRGVGRLVVAGAQTDACIRSTIHGAFVRGYDTVLVADAHTTDDYSEYGMPPVEQVIAFTNLSWRHQSAPGRIASVVESADVVFDGPGGGPGDLASAGQRDSQSLGRSAERSVGSRDDARVPPRVFSSSRRSEICAGRLAGNSPPQFGVEQA